MFWTHETPMFDYMTDMKQYITKYIKDNDIQYYQISNPRNYSACPEYRTWRCKIFYAS